VLEDLLLRLQSLDPLSIYLAVFAIAFIENLFPPSPSDVIILFAGSLVGVERIDFLPVLLFATAGSCVGFVAAYKIGFWFGRKIIDEGKIRFLQGEAVQRVEGWFTRYGYGIIVANRFLAGTRAAVSFFAGVSRLYLPTTIALSFLSALAWNGILLGLGFSLGRNWQSIGYYLATYTKIISIVILIAILLVIAIAYFRGRKRGRT
jgi:membrane protein DedA with SNARE-associated domain